MLLDDEEEFSRLGTGGTPANAWMVGELNLIGIAKRQEPVLFDYIVHGSNGVASRPLSDFESQAIARLRRGGSVVNRRTRAEIQIVGAIRAGSACLQCHHPYREGDLLGAMRYVLRRASG